MLLSLIVAMDEQGTIGREHGLPWRLAADLQHFKAITMGKPVIMGRKTHESIGKPLPGRENIIVTRNPDYRSAGCTILTSLDAALDHCKDKQEAVIMGGAELYGQILTRADRIYLTEVHARVTGDTFFPPYKASAWREVTREDFTADEKNEFDYSFVVLERVT